MPYLSDDEINAGILNSYMPQGYQQNKPEERTFGGTLKDIGVSIGKGIVGTGQAAIGLADIITPGQLGKAVEENVVDLSQAQEYLEEQYTPAQKAANARVEAAQGFLPTLGAMIQNPSTIGHAIVESAPSMVAGGFLGKGLLAANALRSGLAAGAIGEGVVTAGQTAENIRQQTPDKTLSLGQAVAAVGAGIGTSALGAIGGKIASKLGIGDIDTYLAGGQLAETSNKGVIRRIIEGGISEGVFEEMPQSMQEQVWMNAATDKPLLEGVKEAGAAGLLTGAAMGGGVNVFTSDTGADTKSDLSPEEQQLIDIDKQISDKINSVKPEEMTPEFFTELNMLEQQRANLRKQPIENIQNEIQLPTDPDELNRQILNLEAVSNPNPGTTELLQQLYQQKENILQSPELEATRRIQAERQDRQTTYENLFGPEQQILSEPATNIIESAETLEQTPIGLRQTDLITRQGKPYQRRDYLENYLNDNVNKDDYEIVEVRSKSFLDQRQNELRAKLNTNISQQERLNILQELSNNQFNIDEINPNDVGYIARLTDDAVDRGKTLWEDGKNIYASEDAYWNAQQEAIRQQVTDTGKRLYASTYEKPIGPVPYEQQVRQERQTELDKIDLAPKSDLDIELENRLSSFEQRTGRKLSSGEILDFVGPDTFEVPLLSGVDKNQLIVAGKYPTEIGGWDPFKKARATLGGYASSAKEYGKKRPRYEKATEDLLKRFLLRPERKLAKDGILLNVSNDPTVIPILDPASGDIVYLSDKGKPEDKKAYDPFAKLTAKLGGKVWPRPMDISPEAVEGYDPNETVPVIGKYQMLQPVADRIAYRDKILRNPLTLSIEANNQNMDIDSYKKLLVRDNMLSRAALNKELGKVKMAEAPNVGSISEQPVQQASNEEIPQPVEQATNLERKTILQDEISARQSEISDLTDELEANMIEQSRLAVNDPMLADLKLTEETLNKSIKQKNAVLGLLQNRFDQGKFEVRSDTEPGQGISISSIQKMYPNQEVFQSDAGKVSVKFKNGLGATFQDVQDIGNGYIQLAIDTGQMDKNGLILGITQGNQVMLHKDYADDRTLWHENKHLLDNLNMITQADNSALTKEFNKLRKAGKLEFGLSTHDNPMRAMEENIANTFAQVMTSREQYRNTALGKFIQKIIDFFDGLLSFGQQTVRGLAREVESGRIYARQGLEQINNQKQFDTINPSDINTQAFKDWFGDSKVVNNEGKPLVVYQGRSTKGLDVLQNPKGDVWATDVKESAENFADIQERYYPNRPKDQQIEREMRGEIYSLYMNLQNPKTISHKITLWNPTKEAEQISLAKQEGYDGLIIQHDNGKKDFVAFNPNQVKSIFNRGTWDKKYPNINFEVRQKFAIPEQEIPQAEYDRMRVENRNIVGKVKQFMRSKGHEVNRTMNKYLGMTSTNLAKIHPMLQAKVRRLDFDTLQRIHNNLNDVLPVLEAVNGTVTKKGMSKNDKSDWDWAVKNGDAGKILSLANKYNFTEQYQTLRSSLDQIHKDLIDVGYKPGFVDTYWPRLLKDREGFLQATREISRDPVFTQALQEKANKLNTSIENLDPDVRAEIIGQKIMEIKSGIGGPANLQGRVYDKIPSDLGKYYMDSSASLVQYIYSTAKNIEARKFFGRVPTKISNAQQIVRQGYNKLTELNNTYDLLASQDRDTADIRSKIKEVKDNIKLSEELIEKYGQTRDFTENIGSYIDELRTNKLVKPDDEATLKDILSARFHERGTSGIANIYKNISLLDTMGSPISALTQIQDLGWSIYVGGLTPRGITNTIKNIAKAIGKRSDISKEDLGIEWIAQEFADADTFSKAVNKVFKITGLNYVDSIGKESLINNSYDNYKVKAKDRSKLFKEIRHMFSSDNETNQVITDLQNNNRDSKNVQFLVFSRLLDFQPASKSEMPEKMLTAGNWRLAYLLKTFTLKQFDIFRRDVWHKLKSGNRDQIIEGLQNMAYLTSIMTLTGAGADELKDFFLGKEAKFEDHVIENFLTLGGANRYIRMQVNREGIGTALGKQILPPFKFVDSIYKDVSNNVTDLHSARFVDSIPVGGKLYYWHFGKGTELKQSSAEQDFKKEGKDVRSFKDRLDNATDKRAFIQANMNEFQTVKRHENMQGNLNKITVLINRLKKVTQTENVKRRINQLESRKEQMYQRYGSYLN